MHRKICLLVLICVFPMISFGLNDPFKKPREVNSLLAYIKSLKYYTELFSKDEAALKERLGNTAVEMVYYVPNNPYAIIDGEVYEAGDYYRGIKILEIARDAVIFHLPSGPLGVGVSPNDIKEMPKKEANVKKSQPAKSQPAKSPKSAYNPFPPNHPMHRRFIQEQMKKNRQK